MPVQPTDTNADRLNKSGADIMNPNASKLRGTEDGSDLENNDEANFGEDVAEDTADSQRNQANYGFAQGAELDSDAEETEEQEYAADGLQRTSRYSAEGTSGDIEREIKSPKDTDEALTDRAKRQ